HAEDDALLEASPRELALHLAADRLPRRRADLRVDAAIGDDLDAALCEQQVDQHAAVVLGVPYAQPREPLDRALARREPAQQRGNRERRLDRELDLPRVALLALADRALDGAERRLGEGRADRVVRAEEVPGEAREVHHHRPDAPPPPKLPPRPPPNPPPAPNPPPPPQPPPPRPPRYRVPPPAPANREKTISNGTATT